MPGLMRSTDGGIRQRTTAHAAGRPRRLAAMGRGGDNEVGHLTRGELVVPKGLLRNPELRASLAGAFERARLPMSRFEVGARGNSRNPRTGMREFYGGGPGDPDNEGEGQAGSGSSGGGNAGNGGGGERSSPSPHAGGYDSRTGGNLSSVAADAHQGVIDAGGTARQASFAAAMADRDAARGATGDRDPWGEAYRGYLGAPSLPAQAGQALARSAREARAAGAPTASELGIETVSGSGMAGSYGTLPDSFEDFIGVPAGDTTFGTIDTTGTLDEGGALFSTNTPEPHFGHHLAAGVLTALTPFGGALRAAGVLPSAQDLVTHPDEYSAPYAPSARGGGEGTPRAAPTTPGEDEAKAATEAWTGIYTPPRTHERYYAPRRPQ